MPVLHSATRRHRATARRQSPIEAARREHGKTGFTGYYWFGPQTGLDSCLTTAFINGIGVAAAGGGTYAAASALTVAGLPAARSVHEGKYLM